MSAVMIFQLCTLLSGQPKFCGPMTINFASKKACEERLSTYNGDGMPWKRLWLKEGAQGDSVMLEPARCVEK